MPRAAGPPLGRAARWLKPSQSGDLLRARHVRGEVAGIVDLAGRGRVRHRRRLDEVPPPQHIGRDVELARRGIDQALDHVGRLRPAGAAIGIDRNGVGVDARASARSRPECRRRRATCRRRDRECTARRPRDRRPCRRRCRCRARESVPSSSSASLAVVMLSRPCASPRKCSVRSAIQRTGRLSRCAASAASAYSR